MGVKHPGHSLVAASDAGLNSSRLFYVRDRLSGRRFLVDTGAAVSIIPPTSLDRTTPHNNPFTLQAINSTNIMSAHSPWISVCAVLSVGRL